MENQIKRTLNSNNFVISDSEELTIGIEKADLEFDGLNRDIIVLGKDIDRMEKEIIEVKPKNTNITLVNKFALDQIVVRGCSSCENKVVEPTSTELNEVYCEACGKRYILASTELLVRLEAREGRIGNVSFKKIPYSSGVHKKLTKAKNYPYGKYHSTK